MRTCKACEAEFDSSRKRFGYVTLCEECDGDDVQKHISVLRVDGKTDYGIDIVRNPSKEQAEYLKSINVSFIPDNQDADEVSQDPDIEE